MTPPLIVVPARGGSKRLAGKNLHPLGGRPLLAHTVEFLRGEGLLAAAILSTDDPAIAACGKALGLAVPFERPAALAQDTSATTDVVRHALDWLAASSRHQPAMICVLQPTSPFRRQGLLRDAIATLERRRDANAIIAMRRLPVSTRHIYQAAERATVEPLGEGERDAWMPTGALYLARTDAFLAVSNLYAPPILPIEVSAIEAIDIDTIEDLQLAQAAIDAGCALTREPEAAAS